MATTVTTTVSPTPAAVANAYDQFSSLFSEMLGGCIHVGYWGDNASNEPIETATDRLTIMVADRLNLSPGKRVLDVGCGTGKPATQIATGHDVRITGITVSKRQIELAEARFGSETKAEKVSFQLANAMDLPFSDASFDGAYAIESLVHMHDKPAALAHIARVLRPGSRLVIADLFVEKEGAADAPDPQLLARVCKFFQISAILTYDDYQRLLQQAGLRIVEFTDIRRNVQRTYEIMATTFRQKAPSFDEEIAAQLRGAASDLDQFAQVGYALITAEVVHV